MIRLLLALFLIVWNTILTLGQVTTEEVTVYNYEIQLPGTLSYTGTSSPLLIWVHGSGNIDRNGNQATMGIGANYIQQFREAINAKGIAFFSYDKRTANASNATFIQEKGVVFEDFVSDVKEVLLHFKKDARFSKIILIGHSQGSLVAMLASDKADKYISIAGAGETIDKIIYRQIASQNKELADISQQYFQELKKNGELQNVDPRLLGLFAKPNQPFFASWMALNPTEEIKKLSIPVLLLNGNKDSQVSIDDLKKLQRAKPNATTVIVKNMNHVLKTIKTEEENLKSYQSPNFTLSEELIERITEFVNK